MQISEPTVLGISDQKPRGSYFFEYLGHPNLSTVRDTKLRYVRSTLKYSMFYRSIKKLFIRARSPQVMKCAGQNIGQI